MWRNPDVKNRLTIKEFAGRAGVSIATVSRAFTGNGRISDKTRKKILQLADQLGYSAGRARGSRDCTTPPEIIFFYPEVYSDEPDYFIAEIELAIKRSIACENIFTVTPFDENDDHVIDSAKLRMLEGSIAGAIIVAATPGAKKLAKMAESCSLPYVIIGNIPGFESNSVLYDNEYGAFLAGKYFRETGRKHPAYITGHLDSAKQTGFKRGFGDSNLLVIPGGAGFRFGTNALNYIRKNHPEVGCVLCANDILAMGLMKEAENKGIRIPRDLAVIGFDDIAVSRYFHPAISSVSLHLVKIGKTAVELLRKQFNGENHVQSEVVQCDLVLRQST